MTISTWPSKALQACCAFLVVGVLASPVLAQNDPPGRVARLSYLSGDVSFAPAGSEQWAYAQMNRPLTTGDSLWVASEARAELHVGSSAVRLGGATSVNILNLNDDTLQLKLSQGDMSLRIRTLPGNQNIEIDTPNLAFSVQEPGEYRLSVAADGSSSMVTVRRGNGIVYGDNDSVSLRGNEEMRFSGTDLSQLTIGTAPPYDSLDAWAHERDRIEDASTSARYVSREVIGYEQLDAYGTWDSSSQYGAVWIPRGVAVDWAPYRSGHWCWISPWGWTWVDDSPWGFAPFHYGRWARLGPSWVWVPGPPLINAVPVYAPALVAFVGGGSRGSSFSVSVGGAALSGVAWFPLAPGEHYRPGYGASPHYITNINRTIVVNNTTVNNVTQNVYANQNVPNAVTAVPTAAFVKGQSVAQVAQVLKPQQMANAAVATSAPQLTPTRESVIGPARPIPVPAGAQQSLQRQVVATTPPPTVPGAQNMGASNQARRAVAQIPSAPSVRVLNGTSAPERRNLLNAVEPHVAPAPSPVGNQNVPPSAAPSFARTAPAISAPAPGSGPLPPVAAPRIEQQAIHGPVSPSREFGTVARPPAPQHPAQQAPQQPQVPYEMRRPPAAPVQESPVRAPHPMPAEVQMQLPPRRLEPQAPIEPHRDVQPHPNKTEKDVRDRNDHAYQR